MEIVPTLDLNASPTRTLKGCEFIRFPPGFGSLQANNFPRMVEYYRIAWKLTL
jgi:hypothetical protein